MKDALLVHFPSFVHYISHPRAAYGVACIFRNLTSVGRQARSKRLLLSVIKHIKHGNAGYIVEHLYLELQSYT